MITFLLFLQVIMIDIMLGGDNALVIAAACKHLPREQRDAAMRYGAAGAALLRVGLVFFSLQLLTIPALKLVGGIVLLFIAIGLVKDGEEDEYSVFSGRGMWGAIGAIILADASMSIDNVIAIAAAAQGHIWVVAAGVAISLPLIVYGSRLIMYLMQRFSFIILLGAAMLGWIAGGMAYTDPIVGMLFYPSHAPAWGQYLASAIAAAVVLLIGMGDDEYYGGDTPSDFT